VERMLECKSRQAHMELAGLRSWHVLLRHVHRLD
jgi:hypothetical protein